MAKEVIYTDKDIVRPEDLAQYRIDNDLRKHEMAAQLGIKACRVGEFERFQRKMPRYIQLSFDRLRKMIGVPTGRNPLDYMGQARQMLRNAPQDPRVLEAKEQARRGYRNLRGLRRDVETELCLILFRDLGDAN